MEPRDLVWVKLKCSGRGTLWWPAMVVTFEESRLRKLCKDSVPVKFLKENNYYLVTNKEKDIRPFDCLEKDQLINTSTLILNREKSDEGVTQRLLFDNDLQAIQEMNRERKREKNYDTEEDILPELCRPKKRTRGPPKKTQPKNTKQGIDSNDSDDYSANSGSSSVKSSTVPLSRENPKSKALSLAKKVHTIPSEESMKKIVLNKGNFRSVKRVPKPCVAASSTLTSVASEKLPEEPMKKIILDKEYGRSGKWLRKPHASAISTLTLVASGSGLNNERDNDDKTEQSSEPRGLMVSKLVCITDKRNRTNRGKKPKRVDLNKTIELFTEESEYESNRSVSPVFDRKPTKGGRRGKTFSTRNKKLAAASFASPIQLRRLSKKQDDQSDKETCMSDKLFMLAEDDDASQNDREPPKKMLRSSRLSMRSPSYEKKMIDAPFDTSPSCSPCSTSLSLITASPYCSETTSNDSFSPTQSPTKSSDGLSDAQTQKSATAVLDQTRKNMENDSIGQSPTKSSKQLQMKARADKNADHTVSVPMKCPSVHESPKKSSKRLQLKRNTTHISDGRDTENGLSTGKSATKNSEQLQTKGNILVVKCKAISKVNYGRPENSKWLQTKNSSTLLAKCEAEVQVTISPSCSHMTSDQKCLDSDDSDQPPAAPDFSTPIFRTDNQEDDNSDDSSSLDELPVYTLHTSEKKYPQKFEVYWVKVARYPFWPAVVKNIYKTGKNHKVSVVFFGKAKSGMTVQYHKKKFKMFHADIDEDLVNKAKEYKKDNITVAVNGAQKYLIDRALASEPSSSQELFGPTFDVPMRDEPPASLLDNATCLDDTNVAEEENSNDSYMLLDETMDDLSQKSTVETPEKRILRKRTNTLLEYMKKDETKEHLMKIYNGQIPCFRHSSFFESFKARDKLRQQRTMGPIEDDDELSCVQAVVRKWLPTSDSPHRDLWYFMDVWMPEAEIFAYQHTHGNVSRHKAEKWLISSVKLTKREHASLHEQLIRNADNISPEDKERYDMIRAHKMKQLRLDLHLK